MPQGGVLSPTLFSCYINDIPIENNENEHTLLFADDIIYYQSYLFKNKGKLISNAQEKAASVAQIFLNKLEYWMNMWRLTLAPHKCSQITFSKARSLANDELNISLYSQRIKYEQNPKFLGIVFDPRLNFEKHLENVKTKVNDRINVLRVLSFDRNWSLNSKFLVNIYKVLVRSVMDYANVISSACDKKVIRAFEVLQNDALRVIFKKSKLEHVSIEELRGWAELDSIEMRHEELLNDYYVKCMTTNNPLIKDLFNSYKNFKQRNFRDLSLVDGSSGLVNLMKLDQIRKNNFEALHSEIYETSLCKARWVIKEFITDCYGYGPIGSSFR